MASSTSSWPSAAAATRANISRSACRTDAAPSPRLPSGRLRPSSTGYGEGRGEGALPQAQTRGDAPSPGMSAKDALIPTSPRKRGEVKAVPDAIALRALGQFDEGSPHAPGWKRISEPAAP